MAPEPSTPKKDTTGLKDNSNYRFLLAILRNTENGIIDFETAANDPDIRSASKKACYVKAHNLFKAEGMSLMSTFASGTPRNRTTSNATDGEAKPKATAKPRQPRGKAGKKRKTEEMEEEKDEMEDSKDGIKEEDSKEGIKGEVKDEAGQGV